MAKNTKKKAVRSKKKLPPFVLKRKLRARPKKGETSSPEETPLAIDPDADVSVLNRLWDVVMSRRTADPTVSHSARLLLRGTTKVAQKFGEEAVECLIEAVAWRREAVVTESADVLYHLIVLWVDAGIRPDEVWSEL